MGAAGDSLRRGAGLRRDEINVLLALLLHRVVDAVTSPGQVARRTRKAALKNALALARIRHQIKVVDVIRVALLVVALIRDPLAIGRSLGRRVLTLAVGECFDLEGVESDRVDLRIAPQVLGVGFANPGNIDRPAVRGERGSVVVVVARCDLARCSAGVRIDEEHMRETLRGRAGAIGPPRRSIHQNRALREFGSLGRLRKLDGQRRGLVEDPNREGDPRTVGRPQRRRGVSVESGELRHLPRVNPHHVNLGGARAVGEESDLLPVRRESRRRIAERPFGQLPQSFPARIDNPER